MKKSVILSIHLAFAALAISASTSAHSEVNPPLDPILVSKYAEEYSVSGSEAERRLNIMSNYETILNSLKTEFGQDIAGVYFDNGKDFELVVRTTQSGNIIKNIREYKSNISLPVKVIPNSPLNIPAIVSLIESQAGRLKQIVPSLNALGYNPKNGTISIYIYEPSAPKKLLLQKMQQLQKLGGLSTELIFLDTPIETKALRGGAPINQNTIGSATNISNPCTAAFPAVRNGISGLVTAAHCADSANPEKSKFIYQGYNEQPVNMTMNSYDKYATTHDMAFIVPDNPSNTVSNQFYTSPAGTIDTVRLSNVEPAVGMYVCHQGQKTGNSCGEITRVNFATTAPRRGCPANLTSNTTCSATYVVMTGLNLKVADGDSGGPVYGSIPYGVVSAGGTGPNGAVIVFSQLKYLANYGIKLKAN